MKSEPRAELDFLKNVVFVLVVPSHVAMRVLKPLIQRPSCCGQNISLSFLFGWEQDDSIHVHLFAFFERGL